VPEARDHPQQHDEESQLSTNCGGPGGERAFDDYLDLDPGAFVERVALRYDGGDDGAENHPATGNAR
jgi:hypothetical protein